MKKAIVSGAVCALFFSAAVSASPQCNGTVDKLLVYNSGLVNVQFSFRNEFTHVCNLQVEWKGVKPSTCAMWVSLMHAQKRAAQQVHVLYDEGTATCANLPIYQNASAPVWIGAHN